MNVLKPLTAKQIIYLILIIIWAAIIFAFSNQPAEVSSKNSGGITEKIVKIITNNSNEVSVSESTVDRIEKIVRKSAHFLMCLLGGFLIANFINTTNVIDKRLIIYSILFTVIYACTDEIHQYFIEGRSCQLTDLVIDSLGASAGTTIFLLLRNIKRKLFT